MATNIAQHYLTYCINLKHIEKKGRQSLHPSKHEHLVTSLINPCINKFKITFSITNYFSYQPNDVLLVHATSPYKDLLSMNIWIGRKHKEIKLRSQGQAYLVQTLVLFPHTPFLCWDDT